MPELLLIPFLAVPVLGLTLLARWLLERYVSSQAAGRRNRWPPRQLVLLSSYSDYMGAQMAAARLRAAGVRCMTAPATPLDWYSGGGYEVRVLGRDVERAKRLLAGGGSRHARHHSSVV